MGSRVGSFPRRVRLSGTPKAPAGFRVPRPRLKLNDWARPRLDSTSALAESPTPVSPQGPFVSGGPACRTGSPALVLSVAPGPPSVKLLDLRLGGSRGRARRQEASGPRLLCRAGGPGPLQGTLPAQGPVVPPVLGLCINNLFIKSFIYKPLLPHPPALTGVVTDRRRS